MKDEEGGPVCGFVAEMRPVCFPALVVEASILRRRGVAALPPTWRGEKSAEFRAGGGGRGPFMPNITILIALMLFFGLGGEEAENAPSAQPPN